MWVATGAGRVFVSDNTNAPAGSVTWQRVDPNPAHVITPNRYISSIYVDPANAHHAWISYSGYNVNTPAAVVAARALCGPAWPQRLVVAAAVVSCGRGRVAYPARPKAG
jgi:hypothetical protein